MLGSQIDVRQNLRVRGPPGWALWVGTSRFVAMGYYRLGQSNIERRQAKQEKREARWGLVPLLQAEADMMRVKEYRLQRQQEEEIMGHVPGWEVGKSVYKTGRWMPPIYMLDAPMEKRLVAGLPAEEIISKS